MSVTASIFVNSDMGMKVSILPDGTTTLRIQNGRAVLFFDDVDTFKAWMLGLPIALNYALNDLEDAEPA